MNYFSTIFSKYLGDETMQQLVSDTAFIERILQFEMALARTQAALKMIPQVAMADIQKAIATTKINPIDIAKGTLQNGIPIIPILALVKEKISADNKKYLHFGATSQDAMDTASVLMIKEVIVVLEKNIHTLLKNLQKLEIQYGEIPCMAHTRGQQALPITFGSKISAWIEPLQRQLERLTEIEKRILVIQLGGAVGTLNTYPEKAEKLIPALAKALGLNPSTAWHTQRDGFAEFTNWLAMLTGILGKMGADILWMSQSEINELAEQTAGGKSSAMQHKNNPVLSEALVALAKMNATLQAQQLLSMVHTNERDATAWILEWNAMPQMIINAGTALRHTLTISKQLKVNEAAMQQNVAAFLEKNQLHTKNKKLK